MEIFVHYFCSQRLVRMHTQELEELLKVANICEAQVYNFYFVCVFSQEKQEG